MRKDAPKDKHIDVNGSIAVWIITPFVRWPSPSLPIHSFFYNIQKLSVWELKHTGTLLILCSTLRSCTQYALHKIIKGPDIYICTNQIWPCLISSTDEYDFSVRRSNALRPLHWCDKALLISIFQIKANLYTKRMLVLNCAKTIWTHN